ncbi:beta-hydroxydecanoyl-(acyl-carrier-protein) dehydrase [Gammaproteobacteria bacterium]|nr:beta-hydroxydecanoyl-(acyl-carrier-protein) dehydrase [Gammaproteobacteria bacterium]
MLSNDLNQDITPYLIHDTPMLLLEKLIMATDQEGICEVKVASDGILAPFLDENSALPAWFGLELMAQTIGAWNGWHGAKQQQTPKLGLLLGCRNFKTDLAAFPTQSLLSIYINKLFQDESLASFNCYIKINNCIVSSARLNVYQPNNQELKKILKENSNAK